MEPDGFLTGYFIFADEISVCTIQYLLYDITVIDGV